jgi:2-polyprenyl-3-methyl-5-hydroxy-6-metoxy-1,4-benzoquinol methylase
MNISNTDRDMQDYVVQYKALAFERIQLAYRRKLVLNEIKRYSPKCLLEIGCGLSPLFTNLSPDIVITVIEPALEFFQNANLLAKKYPNTQVINSYLEELKIDQPSYDMIVLSCLLHEVPNPRVMLSSVAELCSNETVVHINVPNAISLHRLLAVAMGIIPEPMALSETQIVMQQQSKTYDISSLTFELSNAGFQVIDQGSIFIKPFTHRQMQDLVDNKFLTKEMLAGFDGLTKWLPEFGSEIWVTAKKIS